MPKILEWNGYKFFFFSNEGWPRDPRHVHVRKGEKSVKFWLDPFVSVAGSFDLSSSELGQLEHVVEQNLEMMRGCWDDHFRR